MTKEVSLEVDLGPLHLKNPIMPASGTFDIRCTLLNEKELNRLGAIIAKSIAFQEREGNPGPRICETNCGLLNAVGVPSKGVEYFIKEELPLLKKANNIIIVSLMGNSIEDFCNLAGYLNNIEEISALEINLSCPNLNNGIPFGVNQDKLYELIFNIKKNTSKPIIAKLSPNVSDIKEMALIAKSAGAEILTIANTLMGMAIDIDKLVPKLGNKIGGLSGPAIRPIIVRMIWEIAQSVDMPIIGVGGVYCAENAIEMLLAGASAVQIGSANFFNPYVMLEIIEGIEKYLIKKKYNSIQDIIGLVKN
ncbi:dihydroorotate dehydrogenase [Candidatus Atribacteria bacterium HGW-Atribacteria-1]|nr:MAG: dihydroorotate dehydrogenase [Candidatus Atribacteria bacterium HGW-Atribacteria-1]